MRVVSTTEPNLTASALVWGAKEASDALNQRNESAEGQAEAGSDPDEPAFTDVEGKPSRTGEPGSTVRGTTGSRTYGEDGYPVRDRDTPHPDEAGCGSGDHCHDWGRPADGGPPTHRDRSPGRLPQPGDPPKPRGPNVPPPEPEPPAVRPQLGASR